MLYVFMAILWASRALLVAEITLTHTDWANPLPVYGLDLLHNRKRSN